MLLETVILLNTIEILSLHPYKPLCFMELIFSTG